MKLQGIIPPLVTPMHAGESIDLAGLRTHIDWLLEHGVHGIFVLGTTGEFYALDEAEKQAITAAAVQHVNRRSPVFVGTGAESTREVLRLTAMAEREGADGVSVITPYFIKPSQAELADHFRRVAESTSLPVVLYSNPATCGGLAIEPRTAARLAELPNIVGIKDSSGDLQNTIELIRSTPERFGVLQGRDTLIHAALEHGAAGAIPASCNVLPQLCVGMFEAHRRGDRAAAAEFQARLHPFRMALALGTGNAAIKEAMTLIGRPAGPNRRPISPLGSDALEKLRTAIAAAKEF